MARTVVEIEQSIINAVATDPRLSTLNSSSKVSIWRLMAYVIAVCVWSLEKLFELHSNEVSTALAEKKPHRLKWYRNKTLDFQYGHDLIKDTDQYDNKGITDEDIQSSKIIKYSAVIEAEKESLLVIKVATEIGGKLGPIPKVQRDSFAAYINEIKDAGVKVNIINYLPDRLFLTIDIYYNPLMINESGYNIIHGSKPVELAIQQYMKELPFNGELVLVHLVDKLQQVPGVVIPNLKHAETSWVNGNTSPYGEITSIDVKKIPESGYFEITDFNAITYKPYV